MRAALNKEEERGGKKERDIISKHKLNHNILQRGENNIYLCFLLRQISTWVYIDYLFAASRDNNHSFKWVWTNFKERLLSKLQAIFLNFHFRLLCHLNAFCFLISALLDIIHCSLACYCVAFHRLRLLWLVSIWFTKLLWSPAEFVFL